jgi:hypothetical protein
MDETEQTPTYLAGIVIGAIVALMLIEVAFRGVS